MSDIGSTTNEATILREDHEGVTTITLNRPQQYNVFSREMIDKLYVTLRDIEEDKSIRVVVIAGRGKAFCAGQDLKEMLKNPNEAWHKVMYQNFSKLMMGLRSIPQPVIARVHGVTSAAGCQLVAHCDLAIASSEARFGLGEIKVGLFGSTPCVALTRIMHLKDVTEMLFTGEFIDARTARERGLVNRVVTPDRLDSSVQELVDSIRTKSAAAISAGKRMLYKQLEMNMADAYKHAAESMARGMASHDAREGIGAFIQKRNPIWQNN